MDMISYAGHAAGAIQPPHAFRDQITHFATRLVRAYRARRDFKTLRHASDHILADIGLTRSQLNLALDAPFWVDPSVKLAASRNRRGR